MQPISQPPMHSFLPLEHRPMFQERPTFQDRSLPQYELPVRRQSQETGVLSSRFAQLRDAVREQPLYNEYGNGVLAGVYNAPVLRKL